MGYREPPRAFKHKASRNTGFALHGWGKLWSAKATHGVKEFENRVRASLPDAVREGPKMNIFLQFFLFLGAGFFDIYVVLCCLACCAPGGVPNMEKPQKTICLCGSEAICAFCAQRPTRPNLRGQVHVAKNNRKTMQAHDPARPDKKNKERTSFETKMVPKWIGILEASR